MRERAILGLGILLLITVSYNYSNFENKGIAYLSVFISFAIICFTIAKILNTKEDYNSVEKETYRLENFDGIFKYQKDGFYINQKENFEFVKWTDILEVNAYAIPVLYHTTQNGLEIITETKSYEFESQQTEGFQKLENQLFKNLPNWKLDSSTIKINNFGLKKTNLYKRELI